YHVGQPLYPIPYTYYQKFLPGGEFGELTAVAIPECLGDSYQAPNGWSFRVVATTPDFFDKIEYDRKSDGTPLRYEFQRSGRNLRDCSTLHGEAFHEAAFEAVVGSIVAAQSGLKIGAEIEPTHGIGAEGHKHEGFKLVGILKPTGTANDRAVFINIEGFYRLEGHALGESSKHEQMAVGAASDASSSTKIADERDHHNKDGEHAANPHHEADEHQGAEHGKDTHSESSEHHDEARESGEHDEHEHHHEHATEPLPIAQREVTSILVLCSNNFVPRELDL